MEDNTQITNEAATIRFLTMIDIEKGYFPRPPCTEDSMRIFHSSPLRKVGSWFSSIRNRHFVLFDGKICYYTLRSNKFGRRILKGSFDISDILYVSLLDDDNWFEIVTKSNVHKGKLRLQCSDPDIYRAWADKLYSCGVPVVGKPISAN